MSSTLPSPPTTPPPISTQDDEGLSEKLDALLESYLNLLDTYTTLRTQLSTQFSSGFFTLAHANRNAAAVLGSGRRFGEEGYDQRMKALRGIRIGQGTSTDPLKEQHHTVKARSEQAYTEEQLYQDEHQIQQTDQPSPPSSSQNSQPNSTSIHPPRPNPPSLPHTIFNTTDLQPNPSSSLPKDPLKWFTPFPPPPLRQTQSHFISAMSYTIPDLLTTISKMSAVEEQIWVVRAEIGMMDEYEDLESSEMARRHEIDDAVMKISIDGSSKRVVKTEALSKAGGASFLPSPSRKENLVSRSKTAEPRSRLLKVE